MATPSAPRRERATPAPNTVTFTARTWAVAGAVVVAMLLVLGLQLASIESQRHRVIDQDRKITALLAGAQPVLTALDPVLRQAATLASPLRRTGSQARAFLARTSPLLDQLPAFLNLADGLVGQAAPLVARLNATDAPGSLAAAGSLARSLAARNQLTDLIASARVLLREIDGRGLLRRSQRAADAVPRLVRLQERLLSAQLTSLDVQRQTLAAQIRGLAIQQEALNHVANLDRKFGGPGPAPVTPPAVPHAPG